MRTKICLTSLLAVLLLTCASVGARQHRDEGLADTSAPVLAGEMPNPATTPGALNPQVTQANIHETICVRGWTASIRPDENYTYQLKRRLVRAQYGFASLRLFELDHLVPLELGGDPFDPRNLWIMWWASAEHPNWNADQKDHLENKLRVLVCAGRLPLATAQQAIAANWVEAYKLYMSW